MLKVVGKTLDTALIVVLLLLSGCSVIQPQQTPEWKKAVKVIVNSTRLQLDVGYKTIQIVEKADKMPPEQRYYYVGKQVYNEVKKLRSKADTKGSGK